ncbi:tRNA (adenosine(37)-N6)-dimethylallyltransferase MiaA [Skermanella pratensis]|uniref:tRNA (adenosine(37)-N6)-dimethylallyltransferase MiaA n=1 Tax=Skermanella pratensis TaxID=2233999 RepID=UPI001300F83B|nr:tRNA (adenosine(37)-N6)-dimethylallyltransferase MiaA [Skermanella pratensis]
MPDKPVVVVGGPTASGKSALALDLAEEFGGTVINADSMQIYAELPVLTARPTAADEARAPHRLYGALSAAERCSAARWQALALAEIREAHKAGRLPIVVGGTGLYIRALMEGLADIPPIPEAVRASVRERRETLGGPGLHALLAGRDPATAARLKPGDSQRLSRALEVLEATGRSITDWQSDPAAGPPPGLRFVPFVVDPPRGALYAACDRRFDAMMERGALDEVRALLELGLSPGLPAMKALGVPELSAYLRGEGGLEDAVAAAKTATRRYAKRQGTWFRHQLGPAHGSHVINAQDSESMQQAVRNIIRKTG